MYASDLYNGYRVHVRTVHGAILVLDPVFRWECLEVFEEFGRGEWIRTTDLLVPNQDDEENQ